ncbi:hypothetical protein GCM10023166_32620 [Paeniglutamicibacter cryotolerans]
MAGPDFISLQTRDLDASQAFYEQYLGLVRSQAGPAHAVVLDTTPIAFALRGIVPGTDLASVAQPGIDAAIWLHATDVQAIDDVLEADGHTIASAPIDGPFGRTFTFADPDGYHVTLHDRARVTGHRPAASPPVTGWPPPGKPLFTTVPRVDDRKKTRALPRPGRPAPPSTWSGRFFPERSHQNASHLEPSGNGEPNQCGVQRHDQCRADPCRNP